ncbi:putative reverse transcriptase zinc-binding domain-containing protein [Helianthus annuus]|nr:putative reverse transcriptase zinc-binding domain-containing protein [Helianthus annuus]
MSRCSNWSPVIETVQNRLSSWKANSLSMGGRLTLIKSVLSSLPIYYLSIFKAPGKVVDRIEALMRNFLWSGTEEFKRIHWVAWEKVTTSKKVGGLGISRLRDVNVSLLSKWGWRFNIESDALWRRFIEFIHCGRGLWSFLPVKKSLPGCWKSLVSALESTLVQGKPITHWSKGKLGNGGKLRFWNDLWYGDVVLKNRWPELYKIDKNKKCLVKERIGIGSNGLRFLANWYRYPHTVAEISEYQDLEKMLLSCKLSTAADTWVWGDGANENFTVVGCKILLSKDRDGTRDTNFKWEAWVPLRINIHVWRADQDRIPTKAALIRRQVNLSDGLCPMCSMQNEDLDHLMVRCGFAYGVWSGISKWCRKMEKKSSERYCYDRVLGDMECS